MKRWAVYVNGRCIGYVNETNEDNARCCALSQYGTADDDWDEMTPEQQLAASIFRIPPLADFSVRQA